MCIVIETKICVFKLTSLLTCSTSVASHDQIMDFSISNGNLRCKFCLECSMVGAMTILAYVNSVSPSCVYFITLHRLHKQTRAESEHNNQNQNQIPSWSWGLYCVDWRVSELINTFDNLDIRSHHFLEEAVSAT